MDLEVTEVGRGTPLVVFVHGVLDRGRSFQPVADLLDGECRLLHYDRRGYGAARHAPGVPVGVHQHIEDVLTVLAGRPALVVGHSFGGMTAMGAATIHPTAVRTPMGRDPDLRAAFDAYPGFTRSFGNMLPIGSVEPDDISDAVLWLLSDEAKWVTAATIPVDAGAAEV